MLLLVWYSALPIYRGWFSSYNPRKTPIARPLGRGMVVFREFLVWPKCYLYLLSSVQYRVILHRDISRVYSSWNKQNVWIYYQIITFQAQLVSIYNHEIFNLSRRWTQLSATAFLSTAIVFARVRDWCFLAMLREFCLECRGEQWPFPGFRAPEPESWRPWSQGRVIPALGMTPSFLLSGACLDQLRGNTMSYTPRTWFNREMSYQWR